MKDGLIEEDFAQIVPKLDVRGLRDLKETGFLAVEALGII